MGRLIFGKRVITSLYRYPIGVNVKLCSMISWARLIFCLFNWLI